MNVPAAIAPSPRLRTGVVAVAMLPPWVAYLIALTGWPDAGWVDVEWLTLGMGVEYASVALFPLLGGLALDPRPPRAIRVGLFLVFSLGVTAFIWQGFGGRGAGLFWINSGVTYAGWLWARPNESRFETVLPRALLSIGCLIVLLFAVIVLSWFSGADQMLLLGLLYFLTLQTLEVTGTFARFHRSFTALQRGVREPRARAGKRDQG